MTKSCNDVNLKVKLNTFFANFHVYVFIECSSARQNLNKFVTKESSIDRLWRFLQDCINTNQVHFAGITVKKCSLFGAAVFKWG